MLWEKKGRHNTASTVEVALKRARELGIRHLVVASNSGDTVEKFLDQGLMEKLLDQGLAEKSLDQGLAEKSLDQGLAGESVDRGLVNQDLVDQGPVAQGQVDQGPVAQGLKLVCVTHHTGFAAPGENEMAPEKRRQLQEKGVQVLTTTHLLAGVDRALRLQFGGLYPAEIIATTLRLFGQGVKVCVEIATMALDAGLIPYGEEIISVAGSSRGADTACVIVPAHSNDFFKTVVKEIICMPRQK